MGIETFDVYIPSAVAIAPYIHISADSADI
jgi:hypothetical protein